MATVIYLLAENKKKFFMCDKIELDNEALRRVLGSRYRYCVGDKYFYTPLVQEGLDDEKDRLCWVRDKHYFNKEALTEAYASETIGDNDVRIGKTYIRRQKEANGRFIEVENFVAEKLYDGIANNPDALASLEKTDFESLCAEIFARRGFEVDLFRASKDGGIDFLAVRNEDTDPLIYAVQCKQPDIIPGKKRHSLGRPVVQQIYGAAKAWDLNGAIAISGSTYTSYAKGFSKLKPHEIFVYDASDILNWIENYRWNEDE